MNEHEARKQDLINEGQSMGLSTKDLKILTTDPYFVGTDGEYQDAKWAADLWDKMMDSRKGKPLHIRGFHYWVQSKRIKRPNGKTYGDDPMKDWRWMMKACQVARYLSIGNWSNLIDVKHHNVTDYDDYDTEMGFHMTDISVEDAVKDEIANMTNELMERALNLAPRFHTDGYQTYHTEIWVEKDSMRQIIEPVCKRNGAAYQPLVGQASVERVDMLARRIIQAADVDKKVRIWYIADWDRYGWWMVSAVARKLEYIMVTEGIEADVKLTRLGLNEDQINHYGLPKAPKLGEAVVELDALEAIYPGELSKIISRAIAPYVDRSSPSILDEENDNMVEKLRDMLEIQLRPVLEKALANIELDEFDIDLQDCVDPDFVPPERDHEVEEDDSWVYDSSREWFDQLEKFKEYKESREEEEA